MPELILVSGALPVKLGYALAGVVTAPPPPSPAPPPPPLLTFSQPDAATVDVAVAGSITNSSATAAGPWGIAALANITTTPSSGSGIAGGATVALSTVATAAGIYSQVLTSTGATIVGQTQDITVSLAAATIATMALASTGTTGSQTSGTITLNGVASVAGTLTFIGGSGATFVPSSLSWVAGESGAAKPFAVSYSGDGAHTVDITNTMGLSKAGAPQTHTTSTAGSALFSVVGFDAQTPEQISIYCPTLRSYAAGTRVNVRYKLTSSGTWIIGHPLIPIDPLISETGGPEAIVSAFAGTIFDLVSGSNYNVELTIVEPSRADVVLTSTRATRALPVAAGSATKTATTADNLQTKFDSLLPGDVLLLADGTYNVNSLLLNVSGTNGQPIYIRGTSRTGTIIRDLTVEGYTGIITLRNAAHVILEDLTLQGSGTDAGISETFSTSIVQSSAGTSIRPTNITMRRVSALGVDRGFVAFMEVDGFLLYGCTLRGNNTWDKSWTDNPAAFDSYPNWTWNDDGVRLPGDGNCAWNNTLSGFGDCFANSGSPSDALRSHASYFYRNKIENTGDDTWEADYASRNVGFYDNYVGNCGTLFSADPVYGGPSWCFRNICINAWRGPFKWNSANSGMLVYANTIAKCGNSWRGTAGWIWNQPNNGGASPAKNWAFRNNLLFKTGTGANGNILSFDAAGSDYYDVDHNGWYSDGVFNWPQQGGSSQSFTSLALARAGLPALNLFLGSVQRHVGDIITASNVFDPALTLTAYTTEYTAMALPTLRAGTTARNAGAAIPGITDSYTGAAPDMGALISGRAIVAHGDPGAQPAWYSAISPGTWGVVTSTSLASSGQAWTGAVPGNGSYPNVVTAWGGGVINIDGVYVGATWIPGPFLILHGGGHNDYGGNELYAVGPFSASSPQYYRLRDPTIPAPQNVSRDASGNPCSIHSYDTLTYISDGTRKWMLRFGDAAYYSVGGALPGMSAYDFNVASPNSNQPWVVAGSNLASIGPYTTVYDPTTNKVWGDEGQTGTYINVFDVATGVTTRYGGKGKVPQGEGDSAFDVGRRIWASIYVSGSTRYLYFFDTRSTGNNWYVPSLTGSGIAILPAPGTPTLECPILWDAVDDRFIIWADEGKTLYTLTPPSTLPYEGGNAWTLAQVVPSSGTVPSAMAQSSNGAQRFCYGRFNYVSFAGVRGYVLLNSVTGSLYFYRPASAT